MSGQAVQTVFSHAWRFIHIWLCWVVSCVASKCISRARKRKLTEREFTELILEFDSLMHIHLKTTFLLTDTDSDTDNITDTNCTQWT